MTATTIRPSRSKQRPVWVRDLEARIVTIFQTAKRNRLTHGEILDMRTSQIFDSPRWRQLTQTEQEYLRGVFSGCMELTQRLDIEWRLGTATVKFSPADIDRWAEGSELSRLCRIPGALFGGHCWKGTDIPFDGWKATN
jgi:hypothetical protein